MRKHAASTLIKLLLGAIIVSFIFFFGYSSYRKGQRDGVVGKGGLVAKVNGRGIPTGQFNFFYDQNFERIKASFKGAEMPDFAKNMARSQTLSQLINRRLLLDLADELGLVVTDEELANTIVLSNQAKGNEFDAIAYRHNFLPYFENRYNLNYEDLVREDLKIKALETLFANAARFPSAEKKETEPVWTFESVAIDTKDAAEKLLTMDQKDLKKELTRLKLEPKKIGPIPLSGRSAIIGGEVSTDDYAAIFSLTKEKPWLSRPIEQNGKFYIVHLVAKGEQKPKGDASVPPANFLEEWMSKLLANAKIENFLKEKE